MDCVRLDDNGIAAEIFPGRSKSDLVFHPDLMARIVEVESNSVALGDRFDGARFVKPMSPAPSPEIPADVFLARLSDAEYLAVLKAAETRLAAGDATLMRWLDGMRIKGSLDLSGRLAVEAEAALVALDVLSAGRAEAVFAPAS